MKSTDFIKKFLIKEVNNLLEHQQYYPLLIYCSLGVETLGAIIDKKPIRAKSQSKVRFASALYELFPNQYAFVNKKNFLFESLRNHSAHNLLPSQHILIIEQPKKTVRHLSTQKNRLCLVVEEFAKDFIKACELCLDKIDNGEVKLKYVEF